MKKLLSINEAAETFNLGRNFLYNLIKTDSTVPAIRIGRVTKINTDLFSEWLDKCTREGRDL